MADLRTAIEVITLSGVISGVGLGTTGSMPTMVLQGICAGCFVMMLLFVVRWFLECKHTPTYIDLTLTCAS